MKKYITRIILNSFAGSEIVPLKLRRAIYKLLGNDVGNARIYSHCYLGGRGLNIGNGCFVNHECFFDLSAPIQIGENCNIGMRCCFVTGTHKIGGGEKRAGNLECAPISVGNGVWIGANVTILPGNIIGDGCIIAAGAVVISHCEKNCLYAGVPAKKIKYID